MIHLVGEDARTVPDWFKRRLKDIDKALVCYFNPFRQIFCIDRCIKGTDCLSSDHVSCEKSTVLLFKHIGEEAINELKKMDAWTKFGGNDEAAMLRQRRERENAKADFDAKADADIREMWEENTKDNKRQVYEIYDTFKTFDMARVHK